MLLEYWRERWRRSDIGFHQDTVNPYLVRYWARLQLAERAPVFVPLCGKSWDMIWLHEQGHPVLGIDISPLAVKDFFSENGLEAHAVGVDSFTGMAHDGIRLLCGDFFDLRPRHVQDALAVYDRAALIAVPAEMRRRYADHLIELTHPRAQILIVTLVYSQEEMSGPPYCVSEEEVVDLYGENFTIEMLETAQVLDKKPRYREKGLSRLEESVYLLRPRRAAAVKRAAD